ncbi:DnaJ domain-containing protein [Pseudomonas oligotrophica]|uniref:DnaJ domain-containing protein n=1 Tax=Pseudomonas oligotrophica TaxID=2912055 RepID=UPI001F226066|nr:DnaJ domain-containing protein [Pseudomonas oligotrophica]MCF7201523.1 DnaJ domain-containing protein [Pseudomonas oligotrophica]
MRFWPLTLVGILLGGWLASIPGALLGGLLGQVADRRLGLDGWPSVLALLRGRPLLRGHDLLFFLLGRLAKSGGRVSEAHIRVARGEMQRLALGSDAQRAAIEAFYRGKRDGIGLRTPLGRLRGRRDEARRLLQACWRMARATGSIGQRQHELILLWGKWMGWAPGEVAALDVAPRAAGEAPASRGGAYEQALRLLGVRADAEPEAIKRAYRRLLSRHHPDKLAGAGASPSAVREATERTRELHAAYALVRQRRGFR